MISMFGATATYEAEEQFSLLLPAAPDLIWGTVAFAIIAVIIYKLAWPTFMRPLDERTVTIEKGLKAAEIARAEVAQERADLDEEVRQAHRDAAQIRETAQANAKSIVAEAQGQAQSQANDILTASQRRIDADADAARRALRSDVGLLATELASRIVGESLTDSELANRVTDRFLAELEASVAPVQQEV